jgi:hypothetical protein
MLFLSTKEGVTCSQCGASLRVEKKRLFPYAALVNLVAVLLAAFSVMAEQYLAGIILLLVWLLIVWGLYPFAVSFSVRGEEQL